MNRFYTWSLAVVMSFFFFVPVSHAQFTVFDLPGADQFFGGCDRVFTPEFPNFTGESMTQQFRCFAEEKQPYIGVPSNENFKETYSHPLWGGMW
jgi:hypothetical protein